MAPVVVLFYRYFLPTPPSEGSGGGAAVDEATLRFFLSNSAHYLPLLLSHQRDLCSKLGEAKGRILLSREGINGTLSFSSAALNEYVKEMENFDLLRDLGLPPDSKGDAPAAGAGRLFSGVDWKTSSGKDGDQEPFPDLKIQLVKEIVNTGGTIDVNDIPKDTGLEISADQFHQILVEAQQNDGGVAAGDEDEDANAPKGKKKEVVLIDVRNTFEHSIGHFLHPHSNPLELGDSAGAASESQDTADNNTGNDDESNKPAPALNPNTVTFSHFDSTFCSRYSDALKDKKVLMYCTGGIRCVKASAMLKQRGVEDVSHLSGGIHRYVEQYGNDGFYKGKLMVFDKRVALDPDSMVTKKGSTEEATKGEKQAETSCSSPDKIVGHCIECQKPYDDISGATLCSVCRDLILLCPECKISLIEFHCERHQPWKEVYFTFLERFTVEELRSQHDGLQYLHDNTYVPAKEHKNVRRTLRKQMDKVLARIKDLEEGSAEVERNAKRRCRTCFESDDVCDGLCWGFWRSLQSPLDGDSKLEPLLPVKVGDRVVPGPNWNTFRYGSKCHPVDSRSRKRPKPSDGAGAFQPSPSTDDRKPKMGTVTEVKAWATGGTELDCVAVLWDAPPGADTNQKVIRYRGKRTRNKGGNAAPQTGIYRWGAVARNGKRMYDVERASVAEH